MENKIKDIAMTIEEVKNLKANDWVLLEKCNKYSDTKGYAEYTRIQSMSLKYEFIECLYNNDIFPLWSYGKSWVFYPLNSSDLAKVNNKIINIACIGSVRDFRNRFGVCTETYLDLTTHSKYWNIGTESQARSHRFDKVEFNHSELMFDNYYCKLYQYVKELRTINLGRKLEMQRSKNNE